MPDRLRQSLAAVLLAVALSGCFHVSSVITVRPDGSATVRDSVTFSGLMAIAMTEAKASGEQDEMFSRAQADARARTLGDDVRVASYEQLEAGYVVVFEVPDIRSMRFSAPDFDSDSSDTDVSAQPIDPDLALSFLFEEGDTSTLRVIVHKPTPEKPSPAPDNTGLGDSAEMLDAFGEMGAMFGDARMVVTLQVEGDITETTASYVGGSQITLFDLPFAALFEQAGALAELSDSGSSDAELYSLLDGVEGVQIQRPGTVRVRFR